ncbi:MAG: hypothetical protein LBV29_04750 [Azoarcus sp.]|nr:hypothetical protein [Azoarcus sp.]
MSHIQYRPRGSDDHSENSQESEQPEELGAQPSEDGLSGGARLAALVLCASEPNGRSSKLGCGQDLLLYISRLEPLEVQHM